MIPIKRDIVAFEGVTCELALYVRDKYQNNIDLTGCTAKMQIRSDIDSEEIILELSTEGGDEDNFLEITDELGKIRLYIETVLPEYAGVYDLNLYSPSGKKYKPIKQSKFKVTGGVTRDS